MIIFNLDLDNTLIYSYKHDIGPEKICVEMYEGREISFTTARTLEKLQEVRQHVAVVPTTTRTVEQYRRIRLGGKTFPYVLACNGGVLLKDGQSDREWYAQSRNRIRDCDGEMRRAKELLERDKNRSFELRDIEGLFLFTKSSNPELSVRKLKAKLDLSVADVMANGSKVYVIPKKLNKGEACKRLKEKLNGTAVIAAGDSNFDLPMLEYADYPIMPEGLYDRYGRKKVREKAMVVKGPGLFSERVQDRVLELIYRGSIE